MIKRLHVEVSPLTNTIYAGSLLKDNRTWAANKQDVTHEVICAFVDHALAFKRQTGKDIELSVDGVVVVQVVVTNLKEQGNE